MIRKSFRYEAILQKGRAAPGRERGASLTEYSLLVALVALGAWMAMRMMAFRIGDCGVLRLAAEEINLADRDPDSFLATRHDEAVRLRNNYCWSVAEPWKQAVGWTPSPRE